jgi:hypothetical protein
MVLRSRDVDDNKQETGYGRNRLLFGELIGNAGQTLLPVCLGSRRSRVTLKHSSGKEYAIVDVLARLANHAFITDSRRSPDHSVIDTLIRLPLIQPGVAPYCLREASICKDR